MSVIGLPNDSREVAYVFYVCCICTVVITFLLDVKVVCKNGIVLVQ